MDSAKTKHESKVDVVMILKNNKYKNILYILVSLLTVVALSYTTKSNVSIPNTFWLWALGVLYLSLYLIFVADKIIKSIILLKRKTYILLLSIILSIVACWLLPFHYQDIVNANKIELGMKDETLFIEALGDKNPKSKGNEVCIEGIKINRKDYNLYNLHLNDDWDFVDARATYLGNKTSQISLELDYRNKYEIKFKKTNNSGKVKIKMGKYEQVYDLYSDEPVQYDNIELKKAFLNNEIETSNIQEGIFYLLYFLIIEILILTVGVHIELKQEHVNLKN